MRFVRQTVESFAPHLRAGQIVCRESTSYPGTTEEEIQATLEAHGWTMGQDRFLVYSPEREDPANPNYNARSIPKVCGGITTNCLAAGMALYESVIDQVVLVSSTRAAEMTKLLESIRRAVNIGLVNEMKMVADRMGTDIYEVIEAAATKPFDFVPYYPRSRPWRSLHPHRPVLLTWKEREYGLNMRFIRIGGASILTCRDG